MHTAKPLLLHTMQSYSNIFRHAYVYEHLSVQLVYEHIHASCGRTHVWVYEEACNFFHLLLFSHLLPSFLHLTLLSSFLLFLPSCLPLPSSPFGLTSVLCFFVYLIFEIWFSSMDLLCTREGADGCKPTPAPCTTRMMHTSPAGKHFTDLFSIVPSIRTNCFVCFFERKIEFSHTGV